MVQSPTWEANWFAASQEIPRISQNPNVHYRTHKRPPPVSTLGQPNPVHIPTSHLIHTINAHSQLAQKFPAVYQKVYRKFINVFTSAAWLHSTPSPTYFFETTF